VKFGIIIWGLLVSVLLNAQDTISVFYDLNAVNSANKITYPNKSNILKIEILGYCDDIGSFEYNSKLSKNRADNVLKEVAKTYKDVEITSVGKGEISLNSTENIESQRKNNRRVNIIFHIEDKPKITRKLTLNNVHFEAGRARIINSSYQELDSVIEYLKELKNAQFTVLGHVCCLTKGRDAEDLDTGIQNLSYTRAEKVYEYLIKRGISKEKLSYKGLKSSFPTGKGEKFDRRVEIEITE
jgi:outer membrane protein OmpA-like peptidoglycan-associated protein